MRDRFKQAAQIRADLYKIRDYYAPALIGSAAPDDCDVKSNTDAGEPVSLHAIDVRAETMRDLTYWCRFILDELNDGTITHGPTSLDVPTLVEYVERWTTLITGQMHDDADNLERDMQKHADDLEALAKGWVRKRIEVGACIAQFVTISPEGVEEFTPCKGTLHAVMVESDGGLLPSKVTCDGTMLHTWQPWEWHALGRALGTAVA